MANVKPLYMETQSNQNEWDALLKIKHLTDELRLADAADFGVGLMAHLRRNARKKLRAFSALRGTMRGVPAIVVGAGPSLKQNGPLLAQFQDKALLIAAGTAFEALETRPSLAVAIDPHLPLKRAKHFDVPLCIQGRVHPDSLNGVSGELLYVPDSHFAFEAWLMEQEEPFDAGWTVGNAGVAIAAFLGCNPIVLVGMDFCYSDGQKYAHKEGEAASLIEAKDRDGKTVFTQRDWLLAVQWMQSFAARHPETTFLNATAEGMSIFPEVRLEDLKWPERPIPTPWGNAPFVSLKKLSEWRMSLKRCQLGVEQEHEPARELLLDPLWRMWKPLFERQTEIPFEENIQRALFLEQVIEEHLTDVREAFYEDGTLRTIERYKNGVREGEALLFWPNGQLKRRVHFVNGKRHGLDEMWNEAGVLVDQGMYEEGQPVGAHQRFLDSGKLIEEIEYLDDRRWNFRYWDKEGTLRHQIDWLDEESCIEKKL